MLRRSFRILAPVLVLLGLTLATATVAHVGGKPPCAKFSGWVLMSYSNPQTIILHVVRGKVNAATTFTMTASTVYTRNGAPATFADIRTGDSGTISAIEELPSGALLACAVTVTGP